MLRLTLPWPTRALWPNARPHWAVRARAAATQRRQAHLLALDEINRNGRPVLSDEIRLRILAYPSSARRWDDDNLIAALKSARDGLADALEIDDARFVVSPIVRMPPVQRGMVVLEVGE